MKYFYIVFFSSLTLIPKLKETTVGVLNCDDDHEADDNNNVDDDGVQFLLLLWHSMREGKDGWKEGKTTQIAVRFTV